MTSTNVWAVGTAISVHTGSQAPLIFNWDGTAWSTVNIGGNGKQNLFAVAALSNGTAYAVGMDGTVGASPLIFFCQ